MTDENIQSITLFREALESGDSLTFSSNGSWSRSWKIGALFARFFGSPFQDACDIARYFDTYLKSVEISSAQLKTSLPKNSSYEEIARAGAAVLARLRPWLDPDRRIATYRITRKQLAVRLKALRDTPLTVFTGEQAKQQSIDAARAQIRAISDSMRELKKQSFAWACHRTISRELLALKYRSLRQKEIYATTRGPQFEKNKAWLSKELLAWKAHVLEEKKVPILSSELTPEDQFKIAETSRYADMVSLLRRDRQTLEEYFRFVFQDTRDSRIPSVHIAVQFPEVQNRITNSFLGIRAARLNNSGLIFKEDANGKKDVLLKINGNYESLRDETKKVTFADGKSFSVAEILLAFSQKPQDVGEFEYFYDGILHAQQKDLPVRLAKKDWYVDLPVFERLSFDQVVARYNLRPKNGEGIVAIKVCREQPDPKRVDNTHGWLEIILPQQDGSYIMQPWGRYSRDYPEDMSDSMIGVISRFSYSFKTVPAFVCYGDEGEFLSYRQQISCPGIITPHQIERLFQKIGDDIQKSRDRRFFFQAQGANCISWCLETLEHTYEKKLPDIFSIDITDINMPGAAHYVAVLLKTMAEKTCSLITHIVRIALSILGGASQPYVWQEEGVERQTALLDNLNFLHGKLHLPSLLFDRPRWERLHEALNAPCA